MPKAKQKKPVTKQANKQSGKQRKRPGTVERLSAREEGRWPPRNLPEDMKDMYRPVKKLVTLRIDADVLAWFRQQGSGYQTRINLALRKAMTGK